MAEPSRTSRLAEGTAARVSGMKKVLAGFREFVSRGNAIELAVGVVVGAAFGAVIASLQNSLISPLIGWIFGQPNLEDLWDIGPYSWQESTEANPISPIKVGAILNALLQFLLTAAAIYFFIVLPLNAWANRRKRLQGTAEQVEEEIAEEVALLREIRDLLASGVTVSPGAPVGAPPGEGGGPADGRGSDEAGPYGTLPPSYPPAG